jgi:hypothetical protein
MAGLLGMAMPTGGGLLDMAAAAPQSETMERAPVATGIDENALFDELKRLRSEARKAQDMHKNGKIGKDELRDILQGYHEKVIGIRRMIGEENFLNPATKADPNYDKARREMLRKPGG